MEIAIVDKTLAATYNQIGLVFPAAAGCDAVHGIAHRRTLRGGHKNRASSESTARLLGRTVVVQVTVQWTLWGAIPSENYP